MDDDTLAKAIMGTIGDVDAYQLPDAKGYSRYGDNPFFSSLPYFLFTLLLFGRTINVYVKSNHRRHSE